MNAERLTSLAKLFGTWLERLLAAGIVAYGVSSTSELVRMNWHDTATFYELIYRVLLMVIGIELVRTLLTHSLEAILELLALWSHARRSRPTSMPSISSCAHWLSSRSWLPGIFSCARSRRSCSGANHPNENGSFRLPRRITHRFACPGADTIDFKEKLN